MKMFLAIVLSFFSVAAQADCVPPNDFYIAETAVGPLSVSQTSFEDAISKVQKAYAAEVAAKGATLQINNLWKDGTVNAQAYQEVHGGKTYFMIDAFGGLARYPGMTKNAFVAVLCHELGHHLGGAPRYDKNTDWAAVEGQADYFATLKCMKKLGISSANPSLALTKVLADLGGEKMPSRSTPDMRKVRSTYEEHPDAQCRLDTMDAGRSCRKNGQLSASDPRPGTCFNYDKNGNAIGKTSRPRCWFAP